ncbi:MULTISPECIES: hypothetical protein [Pelotomaculum]|nr:MULTISPECIES: hypothetical protein [Pelotomaculum]
MLTGTAYHFRIRVGEDRPALTAELTQFFYFGLGEVLEGDVF